MIKALPRPSISNGGWSNKALYPLNPNICGGINWNASNPEGGGLRGEEISPIREPEPVGITIYKRTYESLFGNKARSNPENDKASLAVTIASLLPSRPY